MILDFRNMPNLKNLVDMQALEGLQNTMIPGVNIPGGTNLVGGPGGFFQNIVNMANASQQQGPVLGPDDFGSYTIPVSDPTYRSGFDYARSIAGGIPMEQVIAPGVSYSPEMPMGYTQEQLTTPVGTTPVEPPPPPPTQEPDDPRYLGTGIGGVTIFDDVFDKKRMPPLRDITGGTRDIRDIPPLENLINLGKLFGGGIDQEAIDKIVQERIAERMPTIEQPDFSQFVRREDIPTLIPQVPTGGDFSVDRQALIEDIRKGIDLPVYETPDLSQFVRREDIPSLIPSVPTGREFSIEDIRKGLELPDFSQFARQEDIPTIPTFEQPDLSGFVRQEDIPSLITRVPNGSDFSIDREELIRDIREGIDIPKYEVPDLSGFARLEDIPTFDPNVLKQDILMSIPQQQAPDVSQFVTQEDINRAIAGINIPTYQAPDLSGITTRLSDLEKGLLTLQEPTGGRFSVQQQQRPIGLFV